MDMELVAVIISSGAMSAIIGGVFGCIQNNRGWKKKVFGVLQIILYDRIKYLCRKYIEAGEISGEDLEDLIIMHKKYHDDLDGNGYFDELMLEVKALNRTKKD